MAQKSRTSKMSNGGRQKRNVAHEAARQAKFARRKEAGKVYQYKPNPYKDGTPEYYTEKVNREEKAKSSRLTIARDRSTFAKLENFLEKEKIAKAKAKKK